MSGAASTSNGAMPTGCATSDSPIGPIGVSFPDDWVALELHPAERDRFVNRLVRRQVGAGHAVAPFRRAVEGELRNALREAADRGAVAAAALIDVAPELEFPVLIVNAILSVHAAPSGFDLADVVADWPQRPGESLTPVDLPCGPAVRIARCNEQPLAGSPHSWLLLTSQYFVARPARVVVLQFQTPNLDLATPLAALFDAVAATLVIP